MSNATQHGNILTRSNVGDLPYTQIKRWIHGFISIRFELLFKLTCVLLYNAMISKDFTHKLTCILYRCRHTHYTLHITCNSLVIHPYTRFFPKSHLRPPSPPSLLHVRHNCVLLFATIVGYRINTLIGSVHAAVAFMKSIDTANLQGTS